MNRRHFFSAAAAAGVSVTLARPASAKPPVTQARKGRIMQSVCRWCFSATPLDTLAAECKKIGILSVELLNPDEWDVVKKHGLICAVASFVKANPIHKGFNRVENHDAMVKELEERLPLVQAAGIPCQIVFSRNRGGLDDAEGLRNCAKGLKRLTSLAEQLGVTLVMELLNSKVDHKDYMCDRTPWGVDLVNEVASPRFKLLYDIYHMQIMEGDVIRTITDHFDAIAHFHTAGVPGRRDLDDTQELNYRAIGTALAEKGYAGYLGQEFIPKGDAISALRAAFSVCDV